MCDSGDVTDPASPAEARASAMPGAAPAADPGPAPVNLTALLAEALGKSDVCWLRTPGFNRAVWHAYDRDAVLIVTGPGEQQIPPLPDEVELILRSKDAGTRLLTITARVVVLPPEHAMWPVAAAALAAERLNATDEQVERWRTSGTIYVLHPYGLPVERPGAYAAEAAAYPIPAATGTTGGLKPRHVGKHFAKRKPDAHSAR